MGITVGRDGKKELELEKCGRWLGLACIADPPKPGLG